MKTITHKFRHLVYERKIHCTLKLLLTKAYDNQALYWQAIPP